jgi:formamidopyrimidine-DNA glycosylase
VSVTRRAKFLVFELRRSGVRARTIVVGHLGMTGRMYLQRRADKLPKHAAVSLDLGRHRFVFEDPRGFGRFHLEAGALEMLGPEPFGEGFSTEYFATALRRSRQPIKVKLLDQRLVAGVGNIYASEALLRAGISPRRAARRLSPTEVVRLRDAIRVVLTEAIESGSTLPLDFAGREGREGLFYYGAAEGASEFYEERLRVYDRAGKPCLICQTAIRQLVQAGRSTYFCPKCQA